MPFKGDNRITQLNFSELASFWGGSKSHGGPHPRQVPLGSQTSPVAREDEGETTQDASEEPVRGPRHSVAIKKGSPWEHYEEMYALRLGLDHRARVAEERIQTPSAKVYSIRKFTALGVRTQEMFRNIRHRNFVAAREIFWSGNTCYIVLEYMPCSLYEVRGNEHLTELRLAAVIGQVLDGISYLEQAGLEHGSLTCSNIFLNYNGIIKIGDQEQCYKIQTSQPARKDIGSLGPIVRDLITGGYQNDESAVEGWSDSLDFARKTADASSTTDVLQHRLLQLPWRAVSLIGLANFGIAKARRGCGAIVDNFDDPADAFYN